MEDKELIIDLVNKHFNEIFIDSTLSLNRLIGFCETEEDFYYIVSNKMTNNENIYISEVKNKSYISAVNKPIFLKNAITKEEYEEIERLLSINGSPKEYKIIFEGI